MQEVSSLSRLELFDELEASTIRSPKWRKGRRAQLVVSLRDSAVRITPRNTGLAANTRTSLMAEPFE
jgi:hypothetical protein